MKLLTRLPPTEEHETRDVAVGYYLGQQGNIVLTDAVNQGSNTTAYLDDTERAQVTAEIRALIDSI